LEVRLIPNPIRKVLSTLSTHEVQYLLMGGQACVLYGAAEFSRDCDIAIFCDTANIERLKAALTDLDAFAIAVPPFETDFLLRGHALHFRCREPDTAGIRIDVMARMRGTGTFEQLWHRRATLTDDTGLQIELMSLQDLIAAKKTQRDKDWPMIRRLVEAHYSSHHPQPTDEQLRFWFLQCRTLDILIDLAGKYPEIASDETQRRPLLKFALANDREQLDLQLADEERCERLADQQYWQPLKRELEQLRRNLRG
jgi:hypothetical protein